MRGKNILLILIIIVVAIILVIGGITFAYVTTDFLKTDEQLFYKYLAQIVENIEELRSESLTNYINKLNTTPYESSGKLSPKVDILSGMGQMQNASLDKVNDLNITFSGKIDKVNKKSEQNIKINYSDNVSFPIEYKYVDNLYGIKSNLVLKKYVALRNQDLGELFKKFGMSEVNANKMSTLFEQNSIGTEEKEVVELVKYLKIITKNIKETNFSKTDEDKFVLSLNEQEVATILEEIMQEIKSSDLISEETKKESEEVITKSKIEDYSTDEALRIIVSKSGEITIYFIDKEEVLVTIVVEAVDSNITVKAIPADKAKEAIKSITLSLRKK